MTSKRARLDRYLSAQLGIKRADVRPLLASGRVSVNGNIARDITLNIGPFCHITVDQRVLQNKQPVYLMMNKPAGVVSATKDSQHRTVVDLLPIAIDDLHIVGRLDFNSTGLLLLTNDGRWSRALTEPEQKVPKRYRVTVAKPLNKAYIQAFAEGMYFRYEGITTKPANLKIIDSYHAEVYLVEGRYHQIKRMFGRFQNEVLTLHRLAIGHLSLDPSLALGQSRCLSLTEVTTISSSPCQAKQLSG